MRPVDIFIGLIHAFAICIAVFIIFIAIAILTIALTIETGKIPISRDHQGKLFLDI
jgi:hypothetical protein